MCREFPINNGKALGFIYSSKQFKTKGGVLAGTATTNVFRNPGFRHAMKTTQSPFCSPDEVIFGPDFHQSLYCHLLCGLIFREEVQLVSSTFAHSIVYAFRTFEQVWEELCVDIKEGVLNSKVTVPSIREAMSKLLKPDPELANLIHNKCMGLSNWYGLIPELFPNVKYVQGIMTGSIVISKGTKYLPTYLITLMYVPFQDRSILSCWQQILDLLALVSSNSLHLDLACYFFPSFLHATGYTNYACVPFFETLVAFSFFSFQLKSFILSQ